MRGFGGLVTFLVKDADWRATADIVDAVKIPRIAPSLGGVESLIEQPLVMSYYQCTPEDRRAYGIPDNMIRLSCGIENPDDLVADLAQALDVRRLSECNRHAGIVHASAVVRRHVSRPIAIAWLAAQIHASGHAPLGLTSFGVGAFLGAAIGSNCRDAKRSAAHRTLVVWRSRSLHFIAIVAEHAWLYRDYRRQWQEERTQASPPRQFAERLSRHHHRNVFKPRMEPAALADGRRVDRRNRHGTAVSASRYRVVSNVPNSVNG